MLTAILSHPIRFGVILVVLTVVLYFCRRPRQLGAPYRSLSPSHLAFSSDPTVGHGLLPTPVVETVQIKLVDRLRIGRSLSPER